MRVKEQFNKHANTYPNYSLIQQKGAELLVQSLPKELGVTIDLGCGNGRLYRALLHNNHTIEEFYGVDFASNMLNLHPRSPYIKLLQGNFNSPSTFKRLKRLGADTLLSASALQWSDNLDYTLKECAALAPFGAFFIFSSGTFKTLHKIANAISPIYTKDQVEKAFLSHYTALNMQTFNFKLSFTTNLQMLRYIKKSGVSGNLQLSYRALKRVLNEYPLDYLEFEALLLTGEAK